MTLYLTSRKTFDKALKKLGTKRITQISRKNEAEERT